MKQFTEGKEIMNFVKKGKKVADPVKDSPWLALCNREYRGHHSKKSDQAEVAHMQSCHLPFLSNIMYWHHLYLLSESKTINSV